MNLSKEEKLKRATAWWFDVNEVDYEKIIIEDENEATELFKQSIEQLGGDLSLTTVEWLSPNRCLELYDSREYTFFYCDPPYFVEEDGTDKKTCHYNYAEYTMEDFKQMLDTFENDFKGMFMLSGFPTKLLNEYVDRNGWNYLEIRKKSSAHKQTLGKANTKEKVEILCWNYEIDNLKDITGFEFDSDKMTFKPGRNLRKVKQCDLWPVDAKGNKVVGGRFDEEKQKIVRKKINPIRYPGGKFMMLKHILPLIPEHLAYVEPFIGGGSVYWNKPLVKNNVINDLSGNVINFYRQLKLNKDELVHQLKSLLHSRQTYYECVKWLKEKQDTIISDDD